MPASVPSRIGDCRIHEEIGSGSMGVVYRGEDSSGREVAVKVFRPEESITNRQRLELHDRFVQEAQLLEEIDHPNVVRVRDFGRSEKRDYIVMEFLEGFNLKELREMGREFTPEEAVDIVKQVLLGLQAIHRSGVVHRDVKPSNVIVDDEGSAVITDFGIARKLAEETLARGDDMLGTPAYMAPEQITGDEVGPKADIYSAGVLLYELITGKRAFPGDLTESIYRVVNENPASPEVYNSALSYQLVRAIERAMSKSPDGRFETAQDFFDELERLNPVDPDREPASSDTTLSTGHFPDGGPDTSGTASVGTTGSGSAAGQGPQQPTAGQQQGGDSGVSHLLQTGALPDGGKQLQTGSRDTVYCVDCGMPNPAAEQDCKRCNAPLLKRDFQSGNDSSGNFSRPTDYQVGRSELLGCMNLAVMLLLLAAVLALLFL